MTTEVQAPAQAPATAQAKTFHTIMRDVLRVHGLAHTFLDAAEFAAVIEHPEKGHLHIVKGADGIKVEFPNGDIATAFLNRRPQGTFIVLRAIRNKHTEEIVPSDQWAEWLEEQGQRRWERGRVLSEQHSVE